VIENISDYKSKGSGKMEETNENAQGRKPKICKLALLSPLVGFFGVLAAIAGCYIRVPYDLTIFIVSMTAALLLGVIATWKIRKSKGSQRGYVLSISGIILVVIIIIAIFLPLFFCPHRRSFVLVCPYNLGGLGKAILIYANDNDGRYPTPYMWCDLLVKYENIDEEQFVCEGALKHGDKGRCHYAINPNCTPNSPNDVVLLFETKGGWNQYGGPELLNSDHHKDTLGEGCNILLNDSHVCFVKTEHFGELKWDNEPKDEPNQ
jgi:hypothetical protein